MTVRTDVATHLHEQCAAALGWPLADTYTLSMQSLRELVRAVDARLAEEISRHINQDRSHVFTEET